ncbi:hypothetical protein HPP92_002353 [Vanilla planifolia]|uniref:ZF-HD dimerization-type domain-containing protein n=1 Tax=Vanilla planifolia TaxID=51239 RepID=A0A835VG82_VANPL|nr:hypothetical protein HPP92_002353 [Vanilla planifolia]
MEQATRPRDSDVKPKAFPLPNGAAKKPSWPLTPAGDADDVLYRECMKNHAATLGGHALDGCGEFMPSPASNHADPPSLKCAACGCHRNFHRRVAGAQRALAAAVSGEDGFEGEGERDDAGEDDVAFDAVAGRRRSSSPPLPYFTSAPHMLLALSSGVRGGVPSPGTGKPLSTNLVVATPPPRKRFRTKFTPEQKERMLQLSERLGWRLQKRDEGLVDECCREIGVEKGVFKVWMHNNKHQLFGSSATRRGAAGGAITPFACAGHGRDGGEVGRAAGDNGSGVIGDGNGNGHVM